jgi:hypothetical protein
MVKARYEFLVESWWNFCSATGVSAEAAEEHLNAPEFFADWEVRLGRMMSDDEMAGRAWRGLMVLLAEGHAEATAWIETDEGRAVMAHAWPKLPTH